MTCFLQSRLFKYSFNTLAPSSLWSPDIKNQPNAISGLKLKEKFKNMPNVSYKESIEDAIKSINLNQGDLLLITGSLYLCSEVLDLN